MILEKWHGMGYSYSIWAHLSFIGFTAGLLVVFIKDSLSVPHGEHGGGKSVKSAEQ